jgi:integrase
MSVWAFRKPDVNQAGGGLLLYRKSGRFGRQPTAMALWGPYFRLCILTGQRSRQEILNMRWDWIDFDKKRLEIPTTKNNQPLIVHLHETALQELKDMKRRQLDAGLDATFVFTTTGKTASSGVSRAKTRLDRLIATNRQNQGITEEMEHWVLHDLRRSQATTLAEEGFSERVADRIQNHVAGGSRPSVVSAVYMLADLLPERARALEHWGDLVVGSDPD